MNQETNHANHEPSYPRGCYDPHDRVRQNNFLEELAIGIATKDLERIRFALKNKFDTKFCEIYAESNPSSVWTVGVKDPTETYIKNMSGWIMQSSDKIIFRIYDCEIPTLQLLIKLWSPHIAKHFEKALHESSDSSLNGKDQEGVTPLIRAAQYSNPDAVKLLLKFEADTNHRCKKGFTALEHARYASKKIERRATKKLEASRSVILLLLSSNIETGYRDAKGPEDEVEIINDADNQNQTPLELAVRLCDLDSVCKLVESGAETNVREHPNDRDYNHFEYIHLFDKVVKLLEDKGPPGIHKRLHTEYVRYHYKLTQGAIRGAQSDRRSPANIQSQSPRVPLSRVKRNQYHRPQPAIPPTNQEQQFHPPLASQPSSSQGEEVPPQLVSPPSPRQDQERLHQSNEGAVGRGNYEYPRSNNFPSTRLQCYLKTGLDGNIQHLLEAEAARNVCRCCVDMTGTIVYFNYVTMVFHPWDPEARKQCYERLRIIFDNLEVPTQKPQNHAIICGESSDPQNYFYTLPPGFINDEIVQHFNILKGYIHPKDQERQEMEISNIQSNDPRSRREYFTSFGFYFHPWDQDSRKRCIERLEQLFQTYKRSHGPASHGHTTQSYNTRRHQADDQNRVLHVPDEYNDPQPDMNHGYQLEPSDEDYQPLNSTANGHESERGGAESAKEGQQLETEAKKKEPDTKPSIKEEEFSDTEPSIKEEEFPENEAVIRRERTLAGRNENYSRDKTPNNTRNPQTKRRRSGRDDEENANKRQKRPRASGGDNQERDEDTSFSISGRRRRGETWGGNACDQAVRPGSMQGPSRKRKGSNEPEQQRISVKRSRN